MGEPRGILSDDFFVNRTAQERAEERTIPLSRKEYDAYDSKKWEHTYFDGKSGGFVVTELDRYNEVVPDRKGGKESDSQRVFRQEREAAIKFASWGFKIEHLADRGVPGGNPDARILKEGANVRVNGVLADIKTLDTPRRFTRNVNRAFTRNHANLALVHLACKRTDKYEEALKTSIKDHFSDGRLHGYYYFDDDDRYYAF